MHEAKHEANHSIEKNIAATLDYSIECDLAGTSTNLENEDFSCIPKLCIADSDTELAKNESILLPRFILEDSNDSVYQLRRKPHRNSSSSALPNIDCLLAKGETNGCQLYILMFYI